MRLTSNGTLTTRTGPTPVVLLADGVRQSILTHAGARGYLESGGGLYQTDATAHLDGPLTVMRAAGPGRSFKCRRHEIVFDPVEVDEAYPGLIGFWHSHPFTRTRALSTGDLDCFLRMRKGTRRPVHRFVAVLASPDPRERDPIRGWSKAPQLAAWIIGKDYIQRANLTTTPDPPNTKAARAYSGDHWLVAIRAFTTTDGRESVQVNAGERIRADHPIAQRHPDAFKVAAGGSRYASGFGVVDRIAHWRYSA